MARRAAEHPGSEAALRILTHLVALHADRPPFYRLDDIKNTGIEFWRAASPGLTARKALGAALAEHTDFLEGVVG
ncbi:hypothetical protein ACFVT9_38235 [Kitasatospora cineracea]|uniref:hypothetical protein n=1 Tax=Kitasatospora cineracea TaxID=88074 RepID=UPI0036DF8D31